MSRKNRCASTSPRYVSVEFLAKRWGVAPLTVRRLIAAGTLPAVRIGTKLLRVEMTDVEAYENPIPSAKVG